MNGNSADRLDPASAASKEDLARCLRTLRIRADSPSYRDLEKRALQSGRSLPRTTLGEVLSGRRFPSKAFLLAFVELCGVDPVAEPSWESAWNRLAVHYKTDVRSEPGPGAEDPRPDLSRQELRATRQRVRELEERVAELHAASTARTEASQRAGEAVGRAVEAWTAVADELDRRGERALAARARTALAELAETEFAGAGTGTGAEVGAVARAGVGVGAGTRTAAATGAEAAAPPTGPEPVTAAGPFLTAGALPTAGPRPAAVPPARSAPEADPDAAPLPGRVSGSLPAVWNVEPRNPEFTGRDAVLSDLRRRLGSGTAGGVQALRGVGGVGKTQIAIEFACRFASHYDVVWWIAAEDPALIGEQVAALAVELALAEPGTDTATAVAVLKAHLRGRNRWLLVFDNADDRAGVAKWLPGGPGHVLITSRAGGWEGIATTVPVDVMERDESVALLRTRRPELSPEDADLLASALADLPLALAQAGGFLAETATRVGDYLALLDTHATAVLTEGSTGDYRKPLAGAIDLSATRLARLDPLGLAVVRLCAFLAPESVPVHWLLAFGRSTAGRTPQAPGPLAPGGPLAALALADTDPVALHRGVGSAVRLGLATSTHDGVRLHRLVQAVIRDQLGEEAADVRRHARSVLVQAAPGDPEDPATWATWARVVPHLLAVDPGGADSPELRGLACDAAWYLTERGDSEAAARLAVDLRTSWTASSGPDDRHVLWASRCLARAHREQGRYEAAHLLYQASMPRSRRALGEDDPQTLRLAHGQAINLRLRGRYEESRRLQEDTLARYRRLLGHDHPHTLHSANHLAADLSALGRYEEARELHQETLARYRRVLGDDHPDTLRSANHLAADLSALGRYEEARELHQETLARCRRAFGEDSPHTLRAADSYGTTLRRLGRLEEAHRLQRETLARYRRVLGDDHPQTLRTAHNFSETLLARGEAEEAHRLQADALEAARRVLGTDHPETLHAARHLALIRSGLGR
ncbi:FxSxx-COOH system tetratricopeptide repeat protein [Streptomyces sp. TLI_053]|uniref:FxSxx-COOH system tetratricopeptide repeat protein n=1 Tax=Streptomyces sp. TLI_053 TaxID=1855352 RepID=UPI0013520E61|nr:FxSxx-COOH system tetratricopeptide repeat protein [Streptomyces sp. TLI_053]